MRAIDLKSISKIYGEGEAKVNALKNINLSVEKGEMVCIMGASGSGKSTLLNIIGCIDKPTEGKYNLLGNDVNKCKEKELARIRNESIGFVVQDFALIERYNVLQNVRIPLVYSQKKIKNKKQKVQNVLNQLGILDKIDRLPCHLSGGQKQRVAIARAIINGPEIILADEPTGALDSKTSKEVMVLLKELNKLKNTILIVSHDIDVARHCDRIIYIEDGVINV